MRITFYGGAREVTGSCYLVKGRDVAVLVDCGLFQGQRFAREKNYKPLPFACGQIDSVFLTHAHLDHTGRVPTVCLEGFTGNIFATSPTLEMVKYLWRDAVEIMEIERKEIGRAPLYGIKEIANALKYFRAARYEEKIKLSKKDYARFHDAGHILGSAMLELCIDGETVVFSGDVGNLEPKIIRKTEKLFPGVKTLVCEATYGGRRHKNTGSRSAELLRIIRQTYKRGGTALIPAFAIERTQEILYDLNNFIEKKLLPPKPVYLDSPLAIKMTKTFQNYTEFYNLKDLARTKSGDDLFDFPGLVLAQTRSESKQINFDHGPKIIIAGSGMLTGGRISFHLARYLPDPASALVIVGYQARGTLGRRLLEGRKTVSIFRRPVRVRANIENISGYSAHADEERLLAWMETGDDLEKILLVHGEENSIRSLRQKIKSRLGIDALAPKPGQTVTI